MKTINIRRFNIYGALVLILMISLMVLPGCKKKEEAVKEEGAGGAAIPFKVATFQGSEFSLEAVKGKPVVVNFFASWCGPCRMEAKDLEKAYGTFKPVGVEFIGVAVDDTEEGAKAFVNEYKWSFPAGRDASGEIMKAYNIFAVPQTYIIGKDGAVKYIHSGVIDEEVLTREIRKAL